MFSTDRSDKADSLG